MNESITRGDDGVVGPEAGASAERTSRRMLGLGQLARREEMRAKWSGRPDGKRSHLRALLSELDATVSALRSDSTPATMDAVSDAVRELTSVLDLGAEPELVPCPACGRPGMRGATSCGFCWASLRTVPPPPTRWARP